MYCLWCRGRNEDPWRYDICAACNAALVEQTEICGCKDCLAKLIGSLAVPDMSGMPTHRPSEEDRRLPRGWPEEQDTLCAIALFGGSPHIYGQERLAGGFNRLFGELGPKNLPADTQFSCWIVLNLAELLYMIHNATEGRMALR
jgi:hypothetical protein